MLTALQDCDRVGEIAAHHPAAARVFERLGIDYCCAGKRTLSDACTKKSLDPAKVLQEIRHQCEDGLAPEQDWTSASMTHLADHIETTHHAYIKAELPRIAGLIAKVVRAHGERHPELAEVQRVFAGLAAEMTDHMAKEEQVLFPALRTMELHGTTMDWIARGPIRCLVLEHESAGHALEQMRTLTRGYEVPEGVCATYRVMLASLAQLEADMHQHVHKENNILFPMALAHLGVGA